jgi:hypothetical protein
MDLTASQLEPLSPRLVPVLSRHRWRWPGPHIGHRAVGINIRNSTVLWESPMIYPAFRGNSM